MTRGRRGMSGPAARTAGRSIHASASRRPPRLLVCPPGLRITSRRWPPDLGPPPAARVPNAPRPAPRLPDRSRHLAASPEAGRRPGRPPSPAGPLPGRDPDDADRRLGDAPVLGRQPVGRRAGRPGGRSCTRTSRRPVRAGRVGPGPGGSHDLAAGRIAAGPRRRAGRRSAGPAVRPDRGGRPLAPPARGGRERVRSRLVRVPAPGADHRRSHRPRDRPAPTSRRRGGAATGEGGSGAAVLPHERTTPRRTTRSHRLPRRSTGIDHVVLAGNRLAADPAGRRALRQWVERGGPAVGHARPGGPGRGRPAPRRRPPFEVVDRVGLTTVRLHRAGATRPAAGREFERPVDFVRVVPADGRPGAARGGRVAGRVRPPARPRPTCWSPPSGAAAWQPRRPPARPWRTEDPRGPLGRRPAVTGGCPARRGPGRRTPPAGPAASHCRPDALPTDARGARSGTSVIGRGTAAAILGGFVLAVVGLGGRPAAVPAAGAGRAGWPRRRPPRRRAVFVGPGRGVAAGRAADGRRRPPSSMRSPGPGRPTCTGLFAVYRPESGPGPAGGPTRGGCWNWTRRASRGRSRRRVQTDTDAWHREGAGPSRPGCGPGGSGRPSRPGPVAAVARFGPTGSRGRLAAAGFRDPADALFLTPGPASRVAVGLAGRPVRRRRRATPCPPASSSPGPC